MLDEMTGTGGGVMIALGALALLAVGWGIAQRRRLAETCRERDEARRELSETRDELAERRNAAARLEQELTQSDAQLDGCRERLESLEAELGEARDRLAEQRERSARLEAEREQTALRHREQLALLEEARERLKDEFHQLAGKVFEERQQAYSAQSRESLEALLQPFREQVEQFRQRVETLHGQEQRERGSLKAQLDQLAGLNARLGDEAATLARALKGDQKAQGNWGELILETVLERSGLRRDVEYRREVSIDGEAGRQRPDAVIYLPESRHLIVDAKVSLVAWNRVVNAEGEAEREAAMGDHLRSLRAHVRGLAAKDYPALPGLHSPDFVFLFVAVEPAFAAAFERDPTLFQEAFDRQVVMVTPTTLLASLRTVAGLWSLERQNENARLIGERAERLLTKFSGLVESLQEVGRHLERAGDSHRRAVNRLSEGQGSLVAQARELERLGVRMKKPLPDELVRAAEGEASGAAASGDEPS
ncbi:MULTISPECIES: DNA recombination protein RmuC [Halomonas]|uniref:DNA recombination protein RmuC n=1 Tax=Halomonas halophila TaxID=29573 RepID=A0ABQ0U511_9GAMM|nr:MULTISPECIES: DNA recombination protein RmuC [Halomonas]MDR5890681.1 DNA recombination protein RmuC [Halomonas salina]RAH37595.1 DNA recombination protein RmuC [Halomonas sp. SL1]WJY07604.1 DNA recombination protein RmuC [Halomonas halophila]GEK73236.1 DNA recombination protein RmuC [Halomonas halophila]